MLSICNGGKEANVGEVGRLFFISTLNRGLGTTVGWTAVLAAMGGAGSLRAADKRDVVDTNTAVEEETLAQGCEPDVVVEQEHSRVERSLHWRLVDIHRFLLLRCTDAF